MGEIDLRRDRMTATLRLARRQEAQVSEGAEEDVVISRETKKYFRGAAGGVSSGAATARQPHHDSG